jgi:hypothetical protein
LIDKLDFRASKIGEREKAPAAAAAATANAAVTLEVLTLPTRFDLGDDDK